MARQDRGRDRLPPGAQSTYPRRVERPATAWELRPVEWTSTPFGERVPELPSARTQAVLFMRVTGRLNETIRGSLHALYQTWRARAKPGERLEVSGDWQDAGLGTCVCGFSQFRAEVWVDAGNHADRVVRCLLCNIPMGTGHRVFLVHPVHFSARKRLDQCIGVH